MENTKEYCPNHEERVTSTYAEIYFDDDFCHNQIPIKEDSKLDNKQFHENRDEWVSPSDLLIGVIELKPPFTSKITRGKTHEGICTIGNEVIETERAKFLKRLNTLLDDNDCSWSYILQNEKDIVIKKVRKMYDDIFLNKSKIMTKEMNTFYENSLKELETHVRSEIYVILTSTRAKLISDLNFEIKKRLSKEKSILDAILKKRYTNEVHKIKTYYKLLLDNELKQYNKLTNKALHERNDALSAFYRQIVSENIASTMYVMCTERRKCKIKKFILDNYQTTEISEKIQKIRERQKILDAYKEKDTKITHINKKWEDKIKKILQLFLKFITYSLKLLPEQSTFLLDFERMVVLQINEIQKMPQKSSSILIEEDELNNIFEFDEPTKLDEVCDRDPFIVVGDLNDPTPPKYGSRETLPSDVDLPYIRLQRQFIYAKCHKFEEIKLLLESQRCKCQDIPNSPVTDIFVSNEKPKSPPTSIDSVSSDEPLLIDDIKRLHDCPARNCQDWIKRLTFPYLNSYLDFTEENFERVKTILGNLDKEQLPTTLIDPKQFVNNELPFSATKERYHHVGTQYSSEEDLCVPNIVCSCVDNFLTKPLDTETPKETPSIDLQHLLSRRKISLQNLIHENPNLLNFFTDESFNFVF